MPLCIERCRNKKIQSLELLCSREWCSNAEGCLFPFPIQAVEYCWDLGHSQDGSQLDMAINPQEEEAGLVVRAVLAAPK